MALLVLVGFASVAYADGTVTDVKVVGGSNTVRIEVSASGPVQHRAKALTQPQNQIIVDVFPAKLGGNVKGAMPINKGLVSSASVKQLTDSTVRITVSTVSLPDYKVVTATGSKGLTLSVSTVTMAEGKQTNTPAEPVQAAQPEPKQPKQPVARTPGSSARGEAGAGSSGSSPGRSSYDRPLGLGSGNVGFAPPPCSPPRGQPSQARDSGLRQR